MDRLQLRYDTLVLYNAQNLEIEQLLAYNQNRFDHSKLKDLPAFPLKAEPHLSTWEQYRLQAEEVGAYTALKPRLVQFQFPILAGISQSEDYRAATRRGKPTAGMDRATGLLLSEPDKLQLQIHSSLAGPIPILIAGNRQDFVTLVQALSKRNEPEPIPDSMGSCIIGGYNNWDRVRQYRQQWEAQHPESCSETDWAEEFQRLIPHPERYQDRFILLSAGFYSNVEAESLKLTEEKWRELSLKIRLEHECTHYLTRRLFGSMQNNLLDELIADYRGLVAALGYYRADWFLHFMGLESFPVYRQGGRMENYRGTPPLSERAFKILQALVKTAAENLERFDGKAFQSPRTLAEDISSFLALTTLTLEELASPLAEAILEEAFQQQRQQVSEFLTMGLISASGNEGMASKQEVKQ